MQLFHYLAHMTYGDIDINGSLEVSLFFLLSGFSLALGYGRFKDILLLMSKLINLPLHV